MTLAPGKVYAKTTKTLWDLFDLGDLDEVLRLVADAGIRLTHRLIARPTQAVTPEMLALLRAHRAALIAAMTPVKTDTKVFALAAEHFGRCVALGGGSPKGGAAPQEAAPPHKASFVSAEWLEELVWSDVRRFLENPGEVLERLREQHDAADDAREFEARRKELAKRLAAKQAEKDRYIRAYAQGHISEEELDVYLT